MTKLGLIIGEDNWTFFREIYADLDRHYTTEVYRGKEYHTPLLYGRLNRWALRRGLRAILRGSDVCFFEWASDLLMHASHLEQKCAVVTRLHAFELFEWAPKIDWNAVDRVILVSQAMQQQFCALYPDHAHKSTVVYNGVVLDRFAPAPPRPFAFHLGMLGNIVPIKRVYEVILLLHSLRQQGCDARLHLAGDTTRDPRYLAAVQHLIETLHLGAYVTFYGHVGEPAPWLRGIDVLISNSYWEGQQVALIEAMASGCYCLAHRWTGAEEMLPPENLYVTEAELQQKIIAYAARSPAQQQSEQARLHALAVEKFDIERTKVQIRQVIEQVHASAPSNRRTRSEELGHDAE